MLALGVLAGRNLPSALAESTVCGSHRFQTVELTNSMVEIVDGQTEADAEAARWGEAELTPARIHELGGPGMLDDDRLHLSGIAGYGTDAFILVPMEGQ